MLGLSSQNNFFKCALKRKTSFWNFLQHWKQELLQMLIGDKNIISQEYIAVSDPEMEPHYECDLCGNQVSWELCCFSLLSFLLKICTTLLKNLTPLLLRGLQTGCSPTWWARSTGWCRWKCAMLNFQWFSTDWDLKSLLNVQWFSTDLPEIWKVSNKFQFNRQRFVEWQYPDNHDYLDMSQGELLKLAKKYAENLENLNVKIKTRRSDEVWYLVLLFSFSLPISAGIPVASGKSALEHWEWWDWNSTRRGPRKLQ